MMVDELLDALTQLTEDGMGEYDIAVAFRWKGDTVMSDITSNEEDFDVEMRRV